MKCPVCLQIKEFEGTAQKVCSGCHNMFSHHIDHLTPIEMINMKIRFLKHDKKLYIKQIKEHEQIIQNIRGRVQRVQMELDTWEEYIK